MSEPTQRKAEFLTPFDFRDLSEGEQILWLRLLAPFRVYSEVLQSESILETGFECDGESIPRWLYSIVPPFGTTRKGAVPHDGLYTFGGYFRPRADDNTKNGDFVEVDRITADKVYLEFVLLGKVSPIRARIRYQTLRAVGWRAWNKHKKEREKRAKVLEGVKVTTNREPLSGVAGTVTTKEEIKKEDAANL